jgi:hypothetical protein
MNRTTRWWWVAAVALLLWWGCDGGCGCGGPRAVTIPATPKERLDAYARRLPAQTGVGVFLVDMEGFRGGNGALIQRFRGNLPVDAYRQEAQRVLGVDPLDRASTASAGIHPDGGVAVGYYRDAAVVMLYVEDKAKFKLQVLENVKKYYRISADEVASGSQPGVMTLRGGEVSISYHVAESGLVTLAGIKAPASGEALSEARLGEVLGVTPEKSLAARTEFVGFVEELGEGWPAVVYLEAPRLLAMAGELFGGLKGYQKEILEAVGAQVEWGGVGWRFVGDELTGRLSLGIKAETLAKFKGLDQAQGAAPMMGALVGEDALVALRLSMDAGLFWREYQALMPERQRLYVQGALKNLKELAQIDVEEDLIKNATGNVVVAVYGVNPLMVLARSATERMKVVTAAAHVQLKEPAKLAAVLDRLVGELGGALERRELDGGVVAWGFSRQSATAPPLTVYLKGDLLTVASNALPEAALVARLGGAAPLSGRVQGEATKRLLGAERASGLYVDMQKVGAMAAPLGGRLIADLLGPQEELVGEVALSPRGLRVEGALRLKALEGAAGAAPAGGAR